MSATIPVDQNEIEILRSFARRIDVADPGAQNNLGVFYFRRGLVDEAIAAFSRALALDERMRVARRNLEIAYGKAGSIKSRATELDQRLAAAPDDIGALVESGIAEKSAGNLDEAEKRVTAAGGKYLDGRPTSDKSYYEAKYKDPLGIVFDLTHTGWVGAVKDVVAKNS